MSRKFRRSWSSTGTDCSLRHSRNFDYALTCLKLNSAFDFLAIHVAYGFLITSSGPCTRWMRQTTPNFDCGDCESSADKWILSVYFQRTVQWQSIVIKWPRPLELWFQHFYLEETVESLPKRKAISRLSNRGKKLEGEGIGSTIPTYRLWLRVCAMAVGRLLNTVLSRVANYSAKANF